MTSRGNVLSAAKYIPGGARPTPAPQNGGAPYYGLVSPLAQQLSNEHGYSNSYGPFLPRPTRTFTDGAFGPFSPIFPVPVDAPAEGAELPDPRLYEYQVGWNLPVGQPGSEGLKLVDFSTLRTIADLYSVARACIEKRKSEIIGLDWDIVPTHEASKAYQGDRQANKDLGERIAKAKKFFRQPDPDYFSFGEFLDSLLEEVFVYDALALILRPKWGKGQGRGLLGSDLDCLELVHGPTIRPLVGIHGEIPRPPAPAYQQYLYGVPRSDYMTMITQRDIDEGGLAGSELQSYKSDQLLYLRTTPRRWTPYGFSPLEQCLIPVLTGLQRQAWQLDYFREGTVPEVYISPGDSTMTPNQIRELQDALNAIAGDPAWHHKIIVLPPGSKTEPQRPTELADQFDEIVMTEVCMAFDVNPMDLGILPKVSTVASPFAAREMAQASRTIHERSATKPLLKFLCNLFDSILHRVCGQDDMKFTFEGLSETQNESAMSDLIVKQVQYGLRSVDEGRAELELPPWNLPETSGPVVFTQMGPVPFEMAPQLLQQQQMQAGGGNSQGSGKRTRATSTSGRGDQYGGPGVPRHGGSQPSAPASTRLSSDVPPERRGTPAHDAARAAIGSGSSKPGGGSPSDNARAAKAEFESLARHLRKGRDIRTWEARHIPGVMMAAIAEDLDKGLSIEEVVGGASDVLLRTLDQHAVQEWALKSGDDGVPKEWPGWEHDLGLIGAYTEIVARAFSEAEGKAGKLREEWARGRVAITKAQYQDLVSDYVHQIFTKALAPLWREAWRLGYVSAEKLCGTGSTGNPEGGGLEEFLASEGRHWIEQISRTGLKNPEHRAEIIARTEVARAQWAAAMQCYRERGIERKHLLVAPDCCRWCRDDAVEGPVPLDAAFASGNVDEPVHVQCRCMPAPWGVNAMPPQAHLGKNAKRSTAGFLLLRCAGTDGAVRYLLQKRSEEVNHPGTWGLPGGGAHAGETPWDAAFREATEEAGNLPELGVQAVIFSCDEDDDYFTFVCDAARFEPGGGKTSFEAAGWGWFTPEEIQGLPLQPNFAETWSAYLGDLLGKAKRRAVLLTGETDHGERRAAGGGGRYLHPHDADGIEMGQEGGGGEPPRWTGDELDRYTEMPYGPRGAPHAGRADDSPHGGGSAGSVSDGSGPVPQDEEVPPDEDDAGEPSRRSRPPNAVGKGAGDYWDPNPVEAEHVYSIMRANFPEKALEWVRRTHWIGPVQVPWERIDDDDIGSWASSHQPEAVSRFAREIKAGTGHLNPSILVQREGSDQAVIVDGHHRALARRKLGIPVLAYIGTVHGKDLEAALETHSSQFHSGSDPRNR